MPTINIELEGDAWRILKRRAKKNLSSPNKLIEDIVRRSMISYSRAGRGISKVDDSLINIFSRERKGRKIVK